MRAKCLDTGVRRYDDFARRNLATIIASTSRPHPGDTTGDDDPARTISETEETR